MADPIVEKTMFDRHFDGMAGINSAALSRRFVAQALWMKRAEIAEKREKDLTRALAKLAEVYDAMGAPRGPARIMAEAVLSDYSDEVAA